MLSIFGQKSLTSFIWKCRERGSAAGATKTPKGNPAAACAVAFISGWATAGRRTSNWGEKWAKMAPQKAAGSPPGGGQAGRNINAPSLPLSAAISANVVVPFCRIIFPLCLPRRGVWPRRAKRSYPLSARLLGPLGELFLRLNDQKGMGKEEGELLQKWLKKMKQRDVKIEGEMGLSRLFLVFTHECICIPSPFHL